MLRHWMLMLALLLPGLAAGSETGDVQAGEGKPGAGDARTPPAESKPALVAYRADRVIPVDGPEVAPGVIIVKGKVIEKIQAAGDPLPEGATVVDLGPGSVAAPALVDPLSQIHLLGRNPDASRRGVIAGADGGPADNRRARVADAIDPRLEIFRRLAGTGYGAFALVPANGHFLSGLAAVVRPVPAAPAAGAGSGRSGAAAEASGPSKADLLLAEEGYLYMGYGLGDSWRRLAEQELKKALEEIKKASTPPPPAQPPAPEARKGEAPAPPPNPQPNPPPQQNPPPAQPAAGAPPPAPPKPPDPLIEALTGKRRVFFNAGSPAVLDHLFRLLDGLQAPLQFVLVTPPLPQTQIERLAARQKSIQGVVLEPRMSTFNDALIYHNSFRMFREAGFQIALVPISDDLDGHTEVFFQLAELCKSGVPEAAVWDAVTLNAAKFIGLEGRIGSLSPGKNASFTVHRGHPLSGTAELLSVYIEGEPVFPAPGKPAPVAAAGTKP